MFLMLPFAGWRVCVCVWWGCLFSALNVFNLFIIWHGRSYCIASSSILLFHLFRRPFLKLQSKMAEALENAFCRSEERGWMNPGVSLRLKRSWRGERERVRKTLQFSDWSAACTHSSPTTAPWSSLDTFSPCQGLKHLQSSSAAAFHCPQPHR